MKRFSFLIIATLLIGCFSLTSCTDMLSSVIDKVTPPDAGGQSDEGHEDSYREQVNTNMEENIISIPVGESLRILQLTDMQIIDASQCRNPDRLNDTEKEKWAPENVEKNCFIQIKDLVTQAQPHLILVTGDIVYGEFDDSGKMLRKFVDFMESLNIPWAPVFGNHDKESAIGIDAICNMLESAEHCLFKTETEEFEDGEGNYAVKIYQGNKLIQMVYMLDTKGCTKATDESIRRVASITENQCKFIEKKAAEAKKETGATVPGILAYHIPSKEFFLAYEEKGYPIEDGIVLGVDVPAEDGDFGAFFEKDTKRCFNPDDFVERLQAIGVIGVFAGHDHLVNTSVVWQGIRWTFGLKCSTYDYHQNGSLGGTLIEINEGKLSVRHIPTLVGY